MDYYHIATCNTSNNVSELECTDGELDQYLSQLSSLTTESTSRVSGQIFQYNNQNATTVNTYSNSENSDTESCSAKTYQQTPSSKQDIIQYTDESYEFTAQLPEEILGVSKLNISSHLTKNQHDDVQENDKSCEFIQQLLDEILDKSESKVNNYLNQAQQQTVINQHEIAQHIDESYEFTQQLPDEILDTSESNINNYLTQSQQQTMKNQREVSQNIDEPYEFTQQLLDEILDTSESKVNNYLTQSQQQQEVRNQHDVAQNTDESYEFTQQLLDDILDTSELNVNTYLSRIQQIIKNQHAITQDNYELYECSLPLSEKISNIPELNIGNHLSQIQQQQIIEDQHDVDQNTDESYEFTQQLLDDILDASESNVNNYLTQSQQQQTVGNQHDLVRDTDESYELTPRLLNEILDASELTFNNYPSQIQQIVENQNTISQNTYETYECTIPTPDEIYNASKFNVSNYLEQIQRQQIVVKNHRVIAQIVSEHNYTLPFPDESHIISVLNTDNTHTKIQYQQITENTHEITQPKNCILQNKKPIPQASIPICESYIISTPSCKFLKSKFGTSLLSWKGGIYSLIVKEIGPEIEDYKIGNIVSPNKKASSADTRNNNRDEKNFSVISNIVKNIFISLVINEIENVEAEYPIEIKHGMSIEDLRNAAINNNMFFEKLSEKYTNITNNMEDIYKDIPTRIYVRTEIKNTARLSFNEALHSHRLTILITNSILNLKERIIKFITQAKPEFILFSFFSKFCGLYLQRQLLQEIKNIGDKISDIEQNFPIPPGIRSNTEINLAIRSYTNTGSIPQNNASGFYDYVHKQIYKFRYNVYSEIKKSRFYYENLSGTINEASEDDLSIFSDRLLEYFKYAAMCLYREKLSNNTSEKKNFFATSTSKTSASEVASIDDKRNISCVTKIGINDDHIVNGIYFLAIKNSDFRHIKFEELFLMEMKIYIQSLHVENIDFSHLYANTMSAIASMMSHKLDKLELELLSTVLIPEKKISTIKDSILRNDYLLYIFSKICEDEFNMINQCDTNLPYGISMKNLLSQENKKNPDPYAYKTSISSITPRQTKPKISYSPESLLDLLRSAILKLPNMLQSKIQNADDSFFVNAIFKNFNGTIISKKSLQEFSNLGRNILQSAHENQHLSYRLERIVDKITKQLPMQNVIKYSKLLSKICNAAHKDNKLINKLDEIILSFEMEIERLSRESIILLDDNTMSLPSKDTANKLFNEFRSEIKSDSINSLSEIFASKYTVGT
ncbi:hypothetical protein [Candidatus Ichthyocystis sparus]|uniref:hypothetical protein n=1 Tax=Candidatus Ichthyocystis sparus TaxID=1561004 RepID=UPI000A8BD739|nr:hypothetical protein [Candidatus Ichthyocystis sparus]